MTTQSTSVLDICNRALALSGSRSVVADLGDGTPSANACNLWYDADRLYMLRAHRWNFARHQELLTLLATAPGVDAQPATNLPWPFMPWAYSYAYPSNCAKFNFILPTFNGPQQSIATPWLGGGPMPVIPFVVSSYNNPSGQPVEAIFTNQCVAYGIWTRDIQNPTLFDSMFTEALSYRLEGSISMQLNGLTPLVGQLQAKAAQMAEEADAQDGNEGTHTQNRDAPWIRARGTGRDVGFRSGYNGFGAGWDSYNGWGDGDAGGWGW